MSIDRALRELINAEVRAQLAPLIASITALQAQHAALSRLADALGHPLKRRPGRPKKIALPRGSTSSRVNNADRACAVIGCRRPARSKGYCSAHYQKYRMLAQTGRLPQSWVDDAGPQSVENVVLARGRAGAKALAELSRT